MAAVIGEALPSAARLAVVEGPAAGGSAVSRAGAVWQLRGITSNLRYTNAAERDRLAAAQQGLGRPGATRAALIPVRKVEAWWELPQDERRAIFEEGSRHIAVGLRYLPAVARRLHHSRELGEAFDFLTWFEFARADTDAFEELVAVLRGTEEWRYVDREVDIRLSHDD
jgi:hypothetical protein